MLQANGLIAQAERACDRQEWREAVELYRQIPMNEGIPISQKLNYFNALANAGKPDVAKAGYLELSYRTPLNIDVHIGTGLFFQGQGKNREAAIFLGRALCVDAESQAALQAFEGLDIWAIDRIDSYCVLGGLAGENFGGKRPSFLIEILIWPKINRAMAAMRRQAWEEAENCFGKILKIAPDHVPMLVQLGHCLREQGKLGEALASYRRAILLAPRDPDVYLHLGHTLKAMERHLSALNAYSTVLQLRPGFAHAEVEIESLERFLLSRGIHIVGDQTERPINPMQQAPVLQSDMIPEPWLSDHQKTIFHKISSALTLRD